MDSSSHSKTILFGFITMFILMVIPMIISINRVTQSQVSLEKVTYKDNVKLILASEIRDQIRLRQAAVRNVLLYDDLFKKDKEMKVMDHIAYTTFQKMKRLESLLVSSQEKAAFATLSITTQDAHPIQQKLVERSFSGDDLATLSDLLGSALGYQQRVSNALDQMVEIQTKSSQDAVSDAKISDKRMVVTIISIGGIATLLGFVIAVSVIRLTQRQATAVAATMDELSRSNEILEEKVENRTAMLKSARDLALASSNAKSCFLANMSHELRTPLNAIIGYGEMIREDILESNEVKYVDDLNNIVGSGKHLLSIIEEVLDLSKIEAGKFDMVPEEVPLFSLINEVRMVIEPLVARNNNSFVVEMNNDPMMYIDHYSLKQVLINMLSNAAKFTSDGHIKMVVDVVGTPRDGVVIFTISDTGIGLPNVSIQNIFKGFTQADISTTRKYGGAGLGLTIAKRLCDLMQGTIAVQSKEDEGSTFIIELPLRMKSVNTTSDSPPRLKVVSGH